MILLLGEYEENQRGSSYEGKPKKLKSAAEKEVTEWFRSGKQRVYPPKPKDKETGKITWEYKDIAICPGVQEELRSKYPEGMVIPL